MTTSARCKLAMAPCVAAGSYSVARASVTLIPVAVVDFTASTQTPYRLSLPEFVVEELAKPPLRPGVLSP